MGLDISSIQGTSPIHENAKHGAAPEVGAPLAEHGREVSVPANLEAALRDIKRVSEAFNRRLSFSVNEKLGQVVVKVIDNDTDKVVREIPPSELQRVYERIREAIGLLFDQSA
jgi:flagellar protein FlaG